MKKQLNQLKSRENRMKHRPGPTNRRSNQWPPFSRTCISLAVTAAVATAAAPQARAQDADRAGVLEEIVVTATRRSQTAQDVPYNITAVTGESLESRGIASVAELFRTLPGAVFVDMGPRSGVNNSNLIIRGLNAEDMARMTSSFATVPVVSTYINETPVFVDLRLKDIERVEILRGPQGTLYGSGSVGGSVRYLYNKPQFDATSFAVSGALGSTRSSGSPNYEIDAVFNLPVGDTFALRVSAGYVDLAGFINQPQINVRRPDGSPELDNGSTDPVADSANFFAAGPVYESARNTNDFEITNVRVSARWQPSDAVDITLSHHRQDDEDGGIAAISPDIFGDSSLESAARTLEPYERDVSLTSIEGDFDMGFATFTASVSSYESEGSGRKDFTGLYQAFPFYVSYYGTTPRPLVDNISAFKDEGTVVEARLASNPGAASRIDWIIGGFFLDQDFASSTTDTFFGYHDYSTSCFIETDTFGDAPCGFGTLYGLEQFNGPVAIVKDVDYYIAQDSNFEDLAFFGEVTFHATDQWQITGGARYIDQKFSSTQTGGLIFVPGGTDQRSIDTSEKDVVFKVNTSFALNDQTNIYATWSEGFRRGGVNALPQQVFGGDINPAVLVFEPDSAENREVGIKGSLYDRVRYNVNYFDIDWDNIQVNTTCTGIALLCVVNAGQAKSRGIEAELHASLTDALSVDLAYTHVNAKLKKLSDRLLEFNEDGTVFSDLGEDLQLPGTPRNSLYAGLEYVQSLRGGLDWIFGVNGSYRSGATSNLTLSDSARVGGFWIWNASVALTSEDWTVRAYANNIADARGLVSRDPLDALGPRRIALISTPRTFGINLSYRIGGI